MLRFLDYKPAEKKKRTNEEKLEYQRQYDKRVKREFRSVWAVGRPWLGHSKGSMSCSVCIEAGTTDPSVRVRNTFVSGCSTMKLEPIKLHEQSANHVKSRAILKAKKTPLETVAHKIICDLNNDVMEKLRVLFLTCHSLASHNRPFSDYEWVCRLDEAKGIKLGSTYRNVTSAKQFTAAIAQFEREKLASEVKSAKFLTFLSDGSTDASVKEQEMFFVRYVVNGNISVRFLAVINVDRPDAESIVSALKDAYSSIDCPWDTICQKVVGLGCDGASVMTGNKTGVIARIQRELPSTVVIHCFAHRYVLFWLLNKL